MGYHDVKILRMTVKLDSLSTLLLPLERDYFSLCVLCTA